MSGLKRGTLVTTMIKPSKLTLRMMLTLGQLIRLLEEGKNAHLPLEVLVTTVVACRLLAIPSTGAGHSGKEMWDAGFTTKGLADGDRQITSFFICLICVTFLGFGLFLEQRLLEGIFICVLLRQRKSTFAWTFGLVLMINVHIGVAQAGLAHDPSSVEYEVGHAHCSGPRDIGAAHGFINAPYDTLQKRASCHVLALLWGWPDTS